jgi:IclR family transcriptional regulator, pca regulon regulatory protein
VTAPDTPRGTKIANTMAVAPSPARSGLAVNNEELAYGLRSIAVAVRTPAGEPVAAVNLAVHRSMVSMDDLIARLSPALRSTAEEISRRFGHRTPAR